MRRGAAIEDHNDITSACNRRSRRNVDGQDRRIVFCGTGRRGACSRSGSGPCGASATRAGARVGGHFQSRGRTGGRVAEGDRHHRRHDDGGVANTDQYRINIVHRAKPAGAIAHAGNTELHYITERSGTIVTGGTIAKGPRGAITYLEVRWLAPSK